MSAVEQLYAADMVEIVLDLPMPVSTNRIWRTYRGRTVKSKEYVEWLLRTDLTVMAGKQFPRRKIHGPFSMDLQVHKGPRSGDLDNKIKPVLDWLQSRDVVRNDSDCCELHVRWVSGDDGIACRVTLRSV